MPETDNEILQRLTRVETKIDLMITDSKTALEALRSAEHANKRLDKIDKIIFWAGTTVIGAIILGLITMYVQSGGVA